MERIKLGDVELPSGELMILDPGLGRFWRHDGEPRSPRAADPATVDVRFVGRDAVQAGRTFDRSFHPEFYYDVASVEKVSELFAAHCRERGLQAQLQVLDRKVPHVERARRALEYGGGLGVVEFNGIWGVVVGGLPHGPIPVVGSLLDGELAQRFRSVDLVIDERAAVARSETVTGVMVDHGQLLCAGLGPLGAFKMWESLDGLADFVFWGRDAAPLAAASQAPELDDGLFGWTDLPMARVGEHAGPIQQRIHEEKLGVNVDYRPHCNLERLNAQIRSSDERNGRLVLDSARTCGFDNRWGDGIFPVIRDLDAQGRTIRVRMDVGNEQMQARMRQMMAKASR